MNEIWSTEEEARRLKARFDALKECGGSQAEFARKTDFKGGKSMVNQHTTGNRPMSLDAAKIYAQEFNCTLGEISPRWEKAVADAGQSLIANSSEHPPGYTEMALDVALMFDQIPAKERLIRSEAFYEIRAVIERLKPSSRTKD